MDVASDLREGLRLHRAGRLPEAASAYQRVLAADPDNADALNLLSVIFYAAGNHELAVTLAEKAVSAHPDYFAAHVNLGNALQAQNRLEEAVAAFQRAITLESGDSAAASNLASALNALGRHEQALASCVQALEGAQDFAPAHNNMGVALTGLGKLGEAVASYRKALSASPDYAEAHYNLGTALIEQGESAQALDHYERAVLLEPDDARMHCSLGDAQQTMGRLEAAITSYRNAVQIDPEYTDAHSNMGLALQAVGDLDAALACSRQALALEPESADLHWNLALVLLQKGAFEEGWREFEWRWKNPDFTTPWRDFPQPQWNGEALDGRTILVHAEQGMGDTLLFVRYLPMVAARGGQVVLECRPPLARLLAAAGGVGRVAAHGEDLPDFDCHVPLMSLARVFTTCLDTVPATVPYLAPPADTPAPAPLAAADGLKVGFAWSGSTTFKANRVRSCEVEHFATLFDLPGVSFFALQVGERASELARLPASDAVHDLGPELGDFADTAAAVAALDLVVSVDTALVHLAGAMGKPTWVLLASAASYLWLSEREDSPWYPTVRLFRQPDWGDWDAVFARVRRELAAMCDGS